MIRRCLHRTGDGGQYPGSINHVAEGSADGEQVLRNNIASKSAVSHSSTCFDSFKITAGYGINYTHGRRWTTQAEAL